MRGALLESRFYDQRANAQNFIMTDDYINLEISCQNLFFRFSLRNVH